MSDSEKDNQLSSISEAIRAKHICHCSQADPAYGAGVAAAIEAFRAGTLK